MQEDRCKVYMNPYMTLASEWTIFQNHLLEVGLTQKRETMALRTLTTVGLFYLSRVRTRLNRISLK